MGNPLSVWPTADASDGGKFGLLKREWAQSPPLSFISSSKRS